MRGVRKDFPGYAHRRAMTFDFVVFCGEFAACSPKGKSRTFKGSGVCLPCHNYASPREDFRRLLPAIINHAAAALWLGGDRSHGRRASLRQRRSAIRPADNVAIPSDTGRPVAFTRRAIQ